LKSAPLQVITILKLIPGKLLLDILRKMASNKCFKQKDFLDFLKKRLEPFLEMKSVRYPLQNNAA
jgi:hypothetical protein